MSLRILKAGLLTTVQDTGRLGFQKAGILVSGAMDVPALRVANLLAGNPEKAAALEITLTGPTIHFDQDYLIALTGADLSATINGSPLKLWRPVFVAKGSILEFGAPLAGCRTYLAIAGGVDVPEVLGSYSTYLGAKIGGYKGRALQAGDILKVKKTGKSLPRILQELIENNNCETHIQLPWAIAASLYPDYETTPTIRAIKGPEYDLFTNESKLSCWDNDFKVSVKSDRMGYHLQGIPLSLIQPRDLLSGAVTCGTVQVPPEGNPIVLMADHQTTGGYPRIAQVITADLPRLAQVMPGHKIRFSKVTLEQAQQLYIQQEQTIEKIKQSLHLKLS